MREKRKLSPHLCAPDLLARITRLLGFDLIDGLKKQLGEVLQHIGAEIEVRARRLKEFG